ncbi:MAG: hypothetical protein AAGG51_01935 [Cyanobacteria bacterium P01_G01_bin.54]
MDSINNRDGLRAVAMSWNSWDKSLSRAPILDCLEKHAFGEINEFISDYKVESNWQPYRHKLVLQKLKRLKWPTIGFRDSEKENFRGSISLWEDRSSAQIFSSREYCEKMSIDSQQAIEFITEIFGMNFIFHTGTVCGEDKPGDFYRENKIPWAPKCFNGCLVWMHLVHPSNYSKYLTRDDILGMPAQEIQEWDNGIIQVQIFDHPFNYDAPENRQIIIEASNYLRDRHLAFIKANSLER